MRIEEDLSEIHLRLTRVFIENRGYEDIFKRFDKPDTFFYIDPPYYKGIFNRDDFEKLRDILAGLKGKFILSINDVAETRKLFKMFHIETVATS